MIAAPRYMAKNVIISQRSDVTMFDHLEMPNDLLDIIRDYCSKHEPECIHNGALLGNSDGVVSAIHCLEDGGIDGGDLSYMGDWYHYPPGQSPNESDIATHKMKRLTNLHGGSFVLLELQGPDVSAYLFSRLQRDE